MCQQPRLHVGCGMHRLPGWLNTDRAVLNRHGVMYLDARKKLPFSDDTFSFVFCEHFISYLTLAEASAFFAECHRILKAGGTFRIATPTWAFLNELETGSDPRYRAYVHWASRDFFGMDYDSPCIVTNSLLFSAMGGKSVYDEEFLKWVLAQVGFSEVIKTRVGQSEHPELRGVEGHGNFVPREINELETVVLEASKS